jgi:hypothetical protein
VAQPGWGLAREELGEEEGEEQWPDHASREVFTCSSMLEFSWKKKKNSILAVLRIHDMLGWIPGSAELCL